MAEVLHRDLTPEQRLFMAQAEALRYGLIDGNEPDFWWLYTSDFVEYVRTWVVVSQMIDGTEIDIPTFRKKILTTMWRPK